MTDSTRTNLLPEPLVSRAKRALAVRLWGSVLIGATSAVSLAVGVAGTIDPSELPPLIAARDEALVSIAMVDELLAERTTELENARLEARLRDRLVDRPDWSVLLSLLGRVSHETATLTIVRLEPDGPGYEARFVGEVPYTLTVMGEAPTTAAVSEMVLGLVDSKVFTRVDLERTSRSGDGDQARYLFEIVCTLGERGAEVKP